MVDASVALKWVLDEPGQAAAEALRSSALLAPSIWLIEAANALSRTAQSGQITPEQADNYLAILLGAPVTTTPSEVEVADAFALSIKLRHPVYDCLYLALALREGIKVVTADKRFFQIASRDAVCRDAITLLGAA